MNILVIGFNRPAQFEQIMDSIIGLGFSLNNVYVSLDGPRTEADHYAQERMLDYLRDKNFNFLRFRKAYENQGCRGGVHSAITWFFSCVEGGLILEDDVLLLSDPTRYIKTAQAGTKSQLLTISLHGLKTDIVQTPESHKRLRIMLCSTTRVWGWYTTRDTWNAFVRFERRGWWAYVLLGQKLRLSPRFILTLMRCRVGIFDTWDYEFNLFCMADKVTCFVPSCWFIRNIGMDSGVHHHGKLGTASLGPEGDQNMPDHCLGKICFASDSAFNRKNLEECHFNYRESNREWLDTYLWKIVVKTVLKLVLRVFRR